MALYPQYSAYPTAAVVVQQPSATIQNTTVVVNQQPVGWSSGMCSCCDDIGSCCLAFCCCNLYYAFLAVRMNENGCVGLCGSDDCCVSGGHMAMRSAFRNKHAIPGDICSDCCAVTWCRPCVMSQLSREMDARGYPGQEFC